MQVPLESFIMVYYLQYEDLQRLATQIQDANHADPSHPHKRFALLHGTF